MKDKKKVVLNFFIALLLIVSLIAVSASIDNSLTGNAAKMFKLK